MDDGGMKDNPAEWVLEEITALKKYIANKLLNDWGSKKISKKEYYEEMDQLSIMYPTKDLK